MLRSDLPPRIYESLRHCAAWRMRPSRLKLTRSRWLAIIVPVFARGTMQDQSSHEIKVPETARDHHEMAEHYQKQAGELHAEIETHKGMLTEFNKGVATNPKTGENPYSKKMRLHCEKYIKAAQNLEQEAVESARLHDLRAKELEGK